MSFHIQLSKIDKKMKFKKIKLSESSGYRSIELNCLF
jgi:hypothetical protein